MQTPKMNPRVRDRYLQVMDHCPDLAPLLFQINQHDRQLAILNWLILNNLTGKRLLYFFNGDCERSFLKVIAFVVMKLERESQVRAVRASEFGPRRS